MASSELLRLDCGHPALYCFDDLDSLLNDETQPTVILMPDGGYGMTLPLVPVLALSPVLASTVREGDMETVVHLPGFSFRTFGLLLNFLMKREVVGTKEAIAELCSLFDVLGFQPKLTAELAEPDNDSLSDIDVETVEPESLSMDVETVDPEPLNMNVVAVQPIGVEPSPCKSTSTDRDADFDVEKTLDFISQCVSEEYATIIKDVKGVDEAITENIVIEEGDETVKKRNKSVKERVKVKPVKSLGLETTNGYISLDSSIGYSLAPAEHDNGFNYVDSENLTDTAIALMAKQCHQELSSSLRVPLKIRYGKYLKRHCCKKCNCSFSNKWYFFKHKNDICALSCPKCKMHFTKRCCYTLHGSVHCKKDYSCKICDEKFMKGDLMMHHVRDVHACKLLCAVCGKIFEKSERLVMHEKLHHFRRRNDFSTVKFDHSQFI